MCALGTLRADEPKDTVPVMPVGVKPSPLTEPTSPRKVTPEFSEDDGRSEDAADPGVDPKQVQAAIDAAYKARAAAEKKKADDKKAKEETEGYAVGTELGGMKVRWNPDNGLIFATTHNDFTLHVGGFLQLDSVWWDEPGRLRGPGGVGTLEDGVFFRRVHAQLDGTAWEVMEFNLEYLFENFGNNTGIGAVEQFYVGMTQLPLLGNVRIGQMRVPQGLEGDHVTGAKAMTWLEASSAADAFEDIFGAGIWMGNHVADDRATWAVMAYKQLGACISGTSGNENPNQQMQAGAPNGAAIMDRNYAYSGRVTFLPEWENEGRCLTHLGASVSYRSSLPVNSPGSTVAAAQPGSSGVNCVDFSARPELRDTIGNYTNVGPGNAKRWIDTGLLQSNAATVLGFEYLSIFGPLSLQSEWLLAYATDVTGVQAGAPAGAVPAAIVAVPSQTLSFNGGYAQVSYFLTGENRLYDRRLGRLNTTYVRPNTPFWFVRDGSGRFCSGLGALELAARYSYLNLDDGPCQGGIMGNLCFGLNWYINNNLKIQFQYCNTNRWGLTATSPAGFQEGDVNSFGIRTQLTF
jgi:phosphate-selective porin OprO/OprP